MIGERRVTAAVVLREGRVLAARRAKGQKNEGLWEFPGGKVEAGESDEACLEREMAEEFGITGKTREHVADSRYVYGAQGESILLCAYLFEWQAGEFELRVHDEIRWVNARELMALALSPADVKIAEEVGGNASLLSQKRSRKPAFGLEDGCENEWQTIRKRRRTPEYASKLAYQVSVSFSCPLHGHDHASVIGLPLGGFRHRSITHAAQRTTERQPVRHSRTVCEANKKGEKHRRELARSGGFLTFFKRLPRIYAANIQSKRRFFVSFLAQERNVLFVLLIPRLPTGRRAYSPPEFPRSWRFCRRGRR